MGGGGVLTYFWGGGVPSKPSNSDAILDGKSKLFFYPISDPPSETQGVGRTKASKSTRKRGGKGEEWGLGRKRERKEGGGGGRRPLPFSPAPAPLPCPCFHLLLLSRRPGFPRMFQTKLQKSIPNFRPDEIRLTIMNYKEATKNT